jgi:hypothetical protein
VAVSDAYFAQVFTSSNQWAISWYRSSPLAISQVEFFFFSGLHDEIMFI